MGELRRRFIRAISFAGCGFLLSVFFAPEIYAILAKHVVDLGYTPKLMHLPGGLSLYLQIGFLGLLIAGIPALIYQLVGFTFPGLYPKEKRVVLYTIPPIVVLFISGIIFSYFFVVPATFSFFDSINKGFAQEQIESTKTENKADTSPTISIGIFGILSINIDKKKEIKEVSKTLDVIVEMKGYINLLIMVIIGVGLAFQIPVIIILLSRIGILNPESIKKNRGYFIFGLLIITFAITSDPLSSLLLGIPLYAMFELSIIISSTWIKKATKNV